LQFANLAILLLIEISELVFKLFNLARLLGLHS